MNKNYIFTSESVSEGHPDKVCDQISDALLDEFLKIDKNARVAVEVMATANKVIIAGETSAIKQISSNRIEEITRNLIKDIGYAQNEFHYDKIAVEILLRKQSSDISIGVDNLGAGDQGIMFGYACNETEHLMPATLYYAHQILRNISNAWRNKEINGVGPDAKSQVTLIYENGQPVKAHSIVVSIQHHQDYNAKDIREMIRPYVIKSLPSAEFMCDEENFYVNPTGIFTIGGPEGDAGLTGRKIIVDTYGGAAPHGGGAFSGKDPSKVDRSAAYAARYLAKNIVAKGFADKCTIQLSYAIGVKDPLSIYINLHDSKLITEAEIMNDFISKLDLSPGGIIEYFNLKNPIYQKTASYGHFGRIPEMDGSFSWEKLDL